MRIYKTRKRTLSKVFESAFKTTGYFTLSKTIKVLCVIILIFICFCLWIWFAPQFSF